jgi:general stress protein 26
MDVASFAEIEEEFMRRVRRIVWCTVATVDTRGRPRTRILHPNWEGPTGWIMTGRNTLKARHLAANPYVSLTYWDQKQENVYVDARAEWADDLVEKQRIWDMFKANQFPYGYDPAMIPGWTSPDAPGFGVLKLTPSRIELSGLSLEPGKVVPTYTWHARRGRR